MRKNRAFTLVEMSVVLVIIGLVILTVFPALQAVRASEQRSLTNSNLAALMRATAAYVQGNGCLPCPTPAGTSGSGFGRVRGAASGAACGTCHAPEGIAPFASLGLPAATAKDGWGHWITMRIDPALAVNFGIVPPTSPCLASDGASCTLGMAQKGLCAATLSSAGRIAVLTPAGATQQAAVIFVSHGPNGFGAYTASPLAGYGSSAHAYNGPATNCTAASGSELCNANGDASFVDASATNNPSDPFDDTLLYLDRNALVSSLGQGACQTAW